ncbi:FAD-dependent oxidoreductase [Oxalobacteraceae bacterium]|nr:FAD-dependent oxidoreductase [Oxalobacteraceae bacterium]
MMPLEFSAWTPEFPELSSSVEECGQATTVSIAAFQLNTNDHAGFDGEHAALDFASPGRALVRAKTKTSLTLRWDIHGWTGLDTGESGVGAAIHLYRSGSNRPIARIDIRVAQGETVLTELPGVVLQDDDKALCVDGFLSVEGGPYLARIGILKLKAGVTRGVLGRRQYFDLAPVVIIGAGAAGLSAANTLLANGDDRILILEARERCGGRGHTQNFPDSEISVDMGCQWLQNANENPWADVMGNRRRQSQHLQTALHHHAGVPILDFDRYESAVSHALYACRADEHLSAALQRTLPEWANAYPEQKFKTETLNPALKELAQRQKTNASLADQNFDPLSEAARVRACKLGQLRNQQYLALPRPRSTVDRDSINQMPFTDELNAFMNGAWHTSDLLRIVKNEKAEEQKKIDATETNELRARLNAEFKAGPGSADAIAALLHEVQGNATLKLALCCEAELDESIEADQFTRNDGGYSKDDDDDDDAGDDDDDDVEDPAELPVEGGPAPDYVFTKLPDYTVPTTKLPGGNFFTVEGFGQRMVDFEKDLSTQKPLQLRVLNRHVTKTVRSAANHVVLSTQLNDETPKYFAAIAVIVAVPTPMIFADPVRSAAVLTFEPPLPLPIMAEFKNLPLGHYKKVILQIPPGTLRERLNTLHEHHVRPGDGSASSSSSTLPPIREICLYTMDGPVPWKFLYRQALNMIVAFVGGVKALELDGADNDTVLAATKNALGCALGADASTAIEAGCVAPFLTSAWSTDPYSLGAYSYTVPGGVVSRTLLQSAVVRERIVFAGEALWEDDYGTAHGAWYSGERAATLLRSTLDPQ